VIVGGKDSVVPVEVAGLIQKIAVNAASVDTRLLPEASHIFPFDESKDEVIRLVLEWIGKPDNR
jgi:pimeloyl-ACP methyl ester carboxylesterase